MLTHSFRNIVIREIVERDEFGLKTNGNRLGRRDQATWCARKKTAAEKKSKTPHRNDEKNTEIDKLWRKNL